MSKFELKLPKMGESVAEATITSWLKEVGETIEMDEAIVEIATDKVDSEVPSEVEGVLIERFFEVDEVVGVGQVIAVIETNGNGELVAEEKEEIIEKLPEDLPTVESVKAKTEEVKHVGSELNSPSGKFFSPLVKNIAKTEGISLDELEAIKGSGKDQRITKNDILAYIEGGRQNTASKKEAVSKPAAKETFKAPEIVTAPPALNDEIIEMSRMGKLISKHMVDSLKTSAHVQSFVEVDVTNVVRWREKVKDEFLKKEGEKITFTPIFMEAIAKAIRDYPMMNISVDGDRVLKHKDINLGMAAALADSTLR